MIRRSPRPTTNFTIIDNAVLRDERLSYRARGVLASILSRPDNWRISGSRLAHEGKEGRDAVNTAIEELVEFGYIVRNKWQNEDGLWNTELVAFDQPATENPQPTTGNPQPATQKPADFQSPTTGKPTTGFPNSDFQSLLTRNDKKKREEEIHMINEVDQESGNDSQFDEFWEKYPRKVGKKKAHTAFKNLSASNKEKALEGLVEYTKFWEQEQTAVEFIPHPTSWIHGMRWEDELEESSEKQIPASGTEIRQYDQPSRPECSTCDSTGYISEQDDQGRYYATRCKECDQ